MSFVVCIEDSVGVGSGVGLQSWGLHASLFAHHGDPPSCWDESLLWDGVLSDTVVWVLGATGARVNELTITHADRTKHDARPVERSARANTHSSRHLGSSIHDRGARHLDLGGSGSAGESESEKHGAETETDQDQTLGAGVVPGAHKHPQGAKDTGR